MLKVISSPGCQKCEMVRRRLEKEGIEFEYVMSFTMEEEEFDKYKDIATEAGNINFPIIIEDGKSITIEDVI